MPKNAPERCSGRDAILVRDASEGEGPQRRPQQRLGRRLEEVAKAVGGGYCRLQMPLQLALANRGTVAGRRLPPPPPPPTRRPIPWAVLRIGVGSRAPSTAPPPPPRAHFLPLRPSPRQVIMQRVIDLACAASKGEFVKAGPGAKPGTMAIHRWDRPSMDSDTGVTRMHAEDGAQWVVAKYTCNVEKTSFDIIKGREVVRIRLFWETGSEHEDFCRLSGLLLDEVMKLRLT